MELINPDSVRLVPGQSVQAVYLEHPDGPSQIGLFLRSLPGGAEPDGEVAITQRAGLIKFDDVLLVVTMVKINGVAEELFDIWWNYHSASGNELFKRMAEQERLTVHIHTEAGTKIAVETENRFRKFFGDLQRIIDKSQPWTEVEFDRALRSFCAESYPKENLWELIEFRADSRDKSAAPGIDDYPGLIPEELREFYAYVPALGHCIKIIPSVFEPQAIEGDPAGYLHAAPVQTVLRCGLRWVRGHPVAPIPFIPGHGLAFPPDDVET